MKLLIAPLHYAANPTDGSEYSRAYDYMSDLAQRKDMAGDVLVGYMKEDTMGNFVIHKFFDRKPDYISNLTRIKFIFWIMVTGMKLHAQTKYDLVWHNGPFAMGETFNLLLLFLGKKVPSIVGPIVTPHTYLAQDEARSMGQKKDLTKSWVKKWDSMTYFLSRVLRPLSDATLRSATRVITKDKTGLQLLKDRGISHCMQIPLGTNNSQFLYARKKVNDGKTIRVLNVSYLVKRKATEDLIQAFKILADTHQINNIQLTVVGDGPEKATIENLIRKLGVGDRVHMRGYIPKEQINAIYRKSDIFVSASVSESLPAMYLEAMASSLPLVIAQNASTDDLKKDDFGGIVVPPHNPHKMALAIANMVGNHERRMHMGKQNYVLSTTTYSFQNNMNRLVDIFHQVAESRI